jgi:hypothetical protein
MRSALRHRRVFTVSAAALAAGTITLFGSASAFADGHHSDNSRDDKPRARHQTHRGGDGGTGGRTNSNCVIPLGVSAGVLGQGDPVNQCDVEGGSGGDGGSGAHY